MSNGSGSGVQLLGRVQNPFALKAMLALNLKGVKYELLEEAYGSGKSDLLAQLNPVHKRIPVLVHNGKPVCDAGNILLYIDEAFPNGPSLLPADPYERAEARFWAAFWDEIVHPALREVGIVQDEEARAGYIQTVREGLARIEEVFQKTSKGKPYFSGQDHFGFLDINIGSFIGWLTVWEKIRNVKLLNEETMPGLAAWRKKFPTHPLVENETKDLDGLMAIANDALEKIKAGTYHQKK